MRLLKQISILSVLIPLLARALNDFEARFFPKGIAVDRANDVINDYLSNAKTSLLTKRTRSTQKKGPRELYLLEDEGRDYPPTFIGRSRAADQLEVISWDPQKNEYDFLIVSDAGPGKVPKIQHPPRESCVVCHQANGPIFSARDWNDFESTGGISGFDHQVRVANRLIQAREVCSTACGDDLQCRRYLVESALNAKKSFKKLPKDIFEFQFLSSIGISMDKKTAPYLKDWQNLLAKRWPKNGYAYPSSVIPDRIRKADGTYQAVLTHFHDRVTSENVDSTLDEFLAGASPGGDLIAVNSDKAADLKKLDPQTPRDLTAAIPLENAAKWIDDNALYCLGLLQSDQALIDKMSSEQIKAFLKSRALDRALGSSGPLTGNNLAQALRSFLHVGSSSSPADNTENTIPAKPSVTGNVFQQYCANCHAKGDPLYPLPLDDPKALRTYVGKDEPYIGLSIAEILKAHSMPIGKRSRDLLRKNPSDLEKMLELLGKQESSIDTSERGTGTRPSLDVHQ